MAEQQSTVVAHGTVVTLQGHAWVLDAQGQRRALQPGDEVQTGQVLITEAGSQLELGLPNGQMLAVAAGRELLVDANLLGNAPVDASEAALKLLDSSPDQLLQALNQGRDLSLELDPTAAGLTGGDASDAHGFVRLLRVSEPVDGSVPPAVFSTSTASSQADTSSGSSLQPLEAKDDSYALDEDQPLTFDVRSNDSNPNGGTLTVVGQPVAEHGSVVVNPDGTLTYTPAANYNGTDTIHYTVRDAIGQTSSANVTLTVNPVNDAPVRVDENGQPIGNTQNVVTQEDVPVSGTIRGSDVDGDALTFSKGSEPAHGSVVVDANGNWTYTPKADYNGGDSFTVVISDGHGGNTTVTVNVGITPVNDAPVLVDGNGNPTSNDQHVVTLEDTPVNGTLHATDVDGDPLTFSKGSEPAHGSVTVNADGSWSYTPSHDYNGSDSFQIVVSDGQGGTTTATIHVGITPVNDAPIFVGGNSQPLAGGQSVSTPEDTPVSGKLAATDVDGDALTFSLSGNPAHGSVNVATDGSWTYTPSANYNGSDSFQVVVSDGHGGTATATVTIGITPANDAPVGVDQTVYTPEDTPLNGQLSASDADGDALSYSLSSGPAHGTLVLNSNGSWTYTPSANYNGPDSFQAVVSDGQGGTDTITIKIGVSAVPDYPTASITLDANITADDVIDATEATQNIAITGTVGGDVQMGDTVTLTVNGHSYSGTVQAGHTFSINVAGADLAADPSHKVQASVTTTNSEGNSASATASEGYSVSNAAPVPTITLDAVTGDNVINAAEAGGNVAVSGSVGGDAQVGDTVTLLINGQNYSTTVQAGKTFSVTVAGADLAAAGTHGISATVTSTDALGHTASATASGSYSVDTNGPASPTTAIAVDNITADNVINAAEAAGNVTVTGKVTGEFQAGDAVTLTVNGHDYHATVAANGTYSVVVAGADLAADTTIDAKVQAHDAAGNVGTVTGSHSHTVDTSASASIAINTIAADNIVNAVEAASTVAVTGTVGGDVKVGDTVTLTVNGHSYTGTVQVGNTFSINVAGSDLVGDASHSVGATVTTITASGNTATASSSGSYSVDTTLPSASITLDANITADNVINSAEAGQTIAVTGTVGGDVKVGDTVTLTVNGHSYTGTVQAGNTFSIGVAGSDLAADAGRTVHASVTTTSASGNSTTATDTEGYSVDVTAPSSATTAISVDNITADNVVNAAEAAGNVTVTGKVTGEFQAGDTVTLLVNGASYTTTAAADGAYSVSIKGSDLAADTTINASVAAHDAAGNVGTVTGSHTHSVDTGAAASIALSTVTADNIVNAAEAAGTIAITGTVGGDVKVGDTVTLSVNGHSYAGTVQAGNVFSINVAGSDLAADPAHSITASVTTTTASGNTASASSTANYGLDTTPPSGATTSITVNSITADNIVNAAEAAGNVTVTGKVTGEFQTGDTVTLLVNGATYTTTAAADGSYSVSVKGSDLAADTTINASVAAHDAAGNVGTVSGSHTHGVDTTGPSATITLDANITADDVINSAEAGQTIAVTGTVGGDVKVGDTLTLTVNGHSYTGSVQAGNTFSIGVAGSDLAADAGHTITASVTTTSASGNSTTATDTEGYSVDVTAPSNATTAISVDNITADNIVNAAEAAGNVTVTGKVTGEFQTGDTVTLLVNGATYTPTAAADGSYSVSVKGSDLAADTTINASVAAHDAAGNVGTVSGSHTHGVDTTGPSATITLDANITADDVINSSEAGQTIAVTGTVGGDVKVGDTVTLTVNGHSYTGSVQAGNTFSIGVAGSDLAADAGRTITASVTTTSASGNSTTATDTEGYSVDVTAPSNATTAISVDNITADNIVNAAEAAGNVTVTGKVTGEFQAGDTVTLLVNGASYTATAAANGTYSVSVKGSDLAADTTINASVAAHDAAGNVGTVTGSHTHSVDTVASARIALNTVTADNIVNAAEAAGPVAITGTVSGDAKAGDTVTLTVNGHSYAGTVQVGNTFSINVAGSDLAADPAHSITASVTTTTASGNTASASSTANYGLDTTPPSGATTTITVDSITADNVVNAAEAAGNVTVTGKVTGEFQTGDTVTLLVNGASYTAAVAADGSYSASVKGTDLAADTTIDASVAAHDAAGNVGTVSTVHTHAVDVTAPNGATTAISVDNITADNVINTAEAAGNVTVTGKVTGEFQAGDAVTLTVNGHDYQTTVAANGTYSVVIGGADLAADTTIDARITAHDAAGNVGTVTGSHTHGVDTTGPSATITLDANITADDVINSSEAGQTIAVTGTVGGDVKVGDTVTLTVNGHSYTGSVQAGNTFSIGVAGSDLAADAGRTITASVTTTSASGNSTTATDTEGYSVDVTAPSNATTAISVDNITADNIVNAAEAAGNVTVTGKVTGEFQAGDSVTLSVNGTSYTTAVAANGTYSVSVKGADLAADTTINATVAAHDAAGNVGTVSGIHTHGVDATAPSNATTAISVNSITADNVLNAAEAAGNVTVTGKVSGEFQAGDTVTLLVNGASYTTTAAADGSYSVSVKGSDLAADTTIDASVQAHDAAGNAGTVSTVHAHTVDTTAPSASITVDKVTADNVINAAEAAGNVTVTGKVSGEFQAGDTVTLQVNGATYTTTAAADGSYSASIKGSDLAADTSINASVLAHDAAGNSANASTVHSHAVDVAGPSATITVNSVTADNVLNAAEAAGNVTVTGKVGGEFQTGDTVTLVVNGTSYSTTAAADGSYSVSVKGSDLAADTTINASVVAHDAAGNTATASAVHSHTVDTSAPNNATTAISVDNITTDNVLNAAEAAGNVLVTGKVTGEFQTGDTVTLLVNGATYTATAAADGSYSVSVKGSDLAADTTIDASVAAHDAAGNLGSASAVHSHTVDTSAPNNAGTAISVNSITADNVVNAAEAAGNVTVTGKVTGEFQTGDTVTLLVNGATYTTTAAADGSYSVSIKGSDLAADTTIDASVQAHDAAGNVGTIATVHAHTVDTTAPSATITVNSITADNLVNAVEAAGNITVTGKVAGEFQAGDTVTLLVNGATYSTTAAADGSYSVSVKGSDLAADTTIDASVTAHDAAGNSAVATIVHSHNVDTTAPNSASTSISVNSITADNVLNAAEAAGNVTVTGKVTGEFQTGDTVTLLVNGATYTASAAADGSYSVSVKGSDLAADTTIDASVAAHDAAGNVGTVTTVHAHTVDTTAPSANIAVNNITADNVLNAVEAAGNVTVTGKVTGEFQAGDAVNLVVNGTTYSTTAAADGSYSVAIKGSDLAADTTIDASIIAHDAAGNTATATTVHAHTVDTTAPNASIAVNNITADNVLNAAEAGGNVTVTGKVSGEFQAGDSVTLVVNGATYTTTAAADGSYSVSVKGSDLTADTTIDASVIAHDVAGNTATATTVHAHTVDTTAPSASITVNNITADNVLNAAEAAGNVVVTGKVTGEFQTGDTVTLLVNGATYTATAAADGSYSVSVKGSDLAADTTIDASVIAHDAAGNTATATTVHAHTVDTVAPSATIAVNNITADNVLNATEAAGNVTVTGKVSGEFQTGDTVTLLVNGATYTTTAAADGSYSVSVKGSDLAADSTVDASVLAHDAAGNTATATTVHTHTVDTTAPNGASTAISVNNITADNVLNTAEAAGNVTVTGKVTGEFKAGDAVTLLVNGVNYATTAAADGSYSVSIKGSDLAADTTIDASVAAHDAAGNVGTVTTVHTHTVDTSAPSNATTAISVNNITADNIVNAAEAATNITVTGKVTGEFQTGDTVTLLVNGTTYTTTAAADGSYSVAVKGSDLVADTSIDAKVAAHDAAGNLGSATSVHNHSVDTTAPSGATTSITVNSVTADNVINAAEAAGNVTVTGKVTGEFQAGDTVTLVVNGVSYAATAAADGSYSTSVKGSDLAANTTITATVAAHDAAGNVGNVSGTHTHAVDLSATASITLNSVTADNIVNASEAASTVAITGTVGGDAHAGDTVTLTVGSKTYTGTVQSGNTYSINVAGSDLVASGSHNLTASVTTSDAAGNPANASTTGSYNVNEYAPVSNPVAVTGTEDTNYVFNWSDFGTTDANGNTGLSIKITSLPADGVLQYNNGSSWVSVTNNQLITQTDISAGKLRFVPDTNESGIDSYSTPGVGDQKQDYARFTFSATDGPNTGNSATIAIDITPVADKPTMTMAGGSLPTTPPTGNGLTLDYFSKMSNYDSNAAGNVATLEAAMKALTPTTTSVVTSVNYDNASHNAVGEDDGVRVTGLVYLEAGKTYTFSGYRDDTFRLEIGGTVVRSDNFNTWGSYTTTAYTPSTSGYYTLEAFQYNGNGIGALSIQVSVNGATAGALGTLPLYTGITSIDTGGGQHGSFVTVGGGGYYPAVYNQGNTNSWISVSKLVPATPDTDGSEKLTVSLSDLANGVSIRDGSGHSFTATATSRTLSLAGWDLNTLQVKAPTNYTGTLNISVLTTSTETANGSSAVTSSSLAITVNAATATTPMMVASLASEDSHATAASSAADTSHATTTSTLSHDQGSTAINTSKLAVALPHAPVASEDVLHQPVVASAAPAAGQGAQSLHLGGDTFRWSLADNHAAPASSPLKASDASTAGSHGLDLRDLLQQRHELGGDLNQHLTNHDADKATTVAGNGPAGQDANRPPAPLAHEQAPLLDSDASGHAALMAELLKKADTGHNHH